MAGMACAMGATLMGGAKIKIFMYSFLNVILRPCQGRTVTRLDGAGTISKFGAPMFEPEVLIGSKYTVLKKVLVTLLGLFGAPRSDSAPPC